MSSVEHTLINGQDQEVRWEVEVSEDSDRALEKKKKKKRKVSTREDFEEGRRWVFTAMPLKVQYWKKMAALESSVWTTVPRADEFCTRLLK